MAQAIIRSGLRHKRENVLLRAIRTFAMKLSNTKQGSNQGPLANKRERENVMKNFGTRVSCVVLTMVLTLSVGLAFGEDAVKVLGARTMANTVDSWAKQFAEKFPGASIVVSPTGSEAGIKAFVEGATEMAMSSRHMTAQEKDRAHQNGVKPAEIQVGSEGLLVIVNSANPINELTMDQIRKIFTGEFSDWSQLGGPAEPIDIAMRPTSESGTSVMFQQLVLGNASFAQKANHFETFPSIASRVGRAKGGVSFCSSSRLSGLPAQIKVIKVKKDKDGAAVAASAQTIKDGSYPILNQIYLYYNETAGKRHVVEFGKHCELVAKNDL